MKEFRASAPSLACAKAHTQVQSRSWSVILRCPEAERDTGLRWMQLTKVAISKQNP